MSKSTSVILPPSRQNPIVYSPDKEELCLPIIIDFLEISGITTTVEEDRFKIIPIDFSQYGVALEICFTPPFQHENHPLLFDLLNKELPKHMLVPATFRSARADNRDIPFHPPVPAGWLRVGKDRNLYLERDEEPSKQVPPSIVDESLIAVATVIHEIYKQLEKKEA